MENMKKLFNSHNNLKKESGAKEIYPAPLSPSKSGAGFTIVELIIVILIIALLTAIVLVNVIGYVNQSRDAAVQANLNSIQTNSVKFIETSGGNYTGFCADTMYTSASAAITAIGTVQSCNVTDTTFCACSSLKVNTASVFCVDSTGAKKVVPATDCATECPATGLCL